MKIKIYNQQGKKQEKEVSLREEVFGVKGSDDLMHQVVVSQMSNRRQNTAHSKGTGDVRGGGRKPWRQKGTGRARHGSIRSPLWRGGGVSFGPTNQRNYKKTVPVAMKRKALFMALSGKVQNNLLILINELKFDSIKTKDIAGALSKLPCKTGSVLIALPKVDKNIILSTRNIPKTSVVQAKDLNALDILNSKYLLMPKQSIKVIEDTFLKKEALAN